MDQPLPQDYDSLLAQFRQLQDKYTQLEELLRHFQSRTFRAKSESLLHVGMKPLFAEEPECKEELPAGDEETTKVTSYERKAKKKRDIPDHLPREEVYLDLTAEEKRCAGCQKDMKKISDKISEKLHIKPAECVVKKFITPVYACPGCEAVKQQTMPHHPIKKCSVTIETLAHIALSKFIDGLPLHRQEKIFNRYGVAINRDQMSRWMISLGERVQRIKMHLHEALILGDFISMDETYLQVLKEKNRRADQKSFLIGQAREGPPGRHIILFHYEPSRAAVTMGKYLAGFKGALLTDGLAVYQSYSNSRQIVHGGCWSHARRSFADAIKTKKNKATVAKDVLLLISQLFRIEKEIGGKDLTEILKERQARSAPILEEIKQIYLEKIDKIPAKSLTGKGLHYLSNQWPLLTSFLKEPYLKIHNNYIERKIKHVATGRKAWLFCTSIDGANASAAIFSVLMTAQENGLQPYDYLIKILSAPESTPIDQLLPFN